MYKVNNGPMIMSIIKMFPILLVYCL